MQPSASWRSPLARSLHRHRTQPHARYFQLATITPEGDPRNRTVVFRGFLPGTNQLKMITDARSEKIVQIQHQPRGEICWYFTETREQFRFSGRLTLVDAADRDPARQQERQQTWQTLSDAARLQFAWPAPEQPRIDDPRAFSPTLPEKEYPLPNFCLLLFDPERVDHLELLGNPQNRWLYRRDRDLTWIVREVNP
jgi:pyridoxamine 5'-phosphate oxidase